MRVRSNCDFKTRMAAVDLIIRDVYGAFSGRRLRNPVRQFVAAMSRFSSSNQCCTTTRLRGVMFSWESGSDLITRKRRPSGETSYVGPAASLERKYRGSNIFEGAAACHSPPGRTATLVSAPDLSQ